MESDNGGTTSSAALEEVGRGWKNNLDDVIVMSSGDHRSFKVKSAWQTVAVKDLKDAV